jgi:hypothetical protein
LRDVQTISTNAARRRQAKLAPSRPFTIECRITSAELARLDVIASEHRVSRWRVMRLALELLFAEQSRVDNGEHAA